MKPEVQRKEEGETEKEEQMEYLPPALNSQSPQSLPSLSFHVVDPTKSRYPLH
jgi:hypothetical protein